MNHLMGTLMLGVTLGCATIMAAEVPAILPRSDASPVSDGKVKVYILAGQSNMVGFGYLKDLRPVCPSIFLSADPNIKVGRMPVGPSALLKYEVYLSAEKGAPSGASVLVYSGACREGADHDSMKPVKEAIIALGTVDDRLPSLEGPHTAVAQAFIKEPMGGMHEIHPGFENCTYAIASPGGREVYRREIGKEAFLTPVLLEQGKRYPIFITYLKSGSTALWLKQIDLKWKGDLASLIRKGKYIWFADEKGEWTVRQDVTYWETRVSNDEGGSGCWRIVFSGNTNCDDRI